MMQFALWHQLWDFARLLGLRDRLRCPRCRAVGSYKPHGGWLDTGDKRGIRRWLCKWCGYYHDAIRVALCGVGDGQWEFCWELTNWNTPQEAVLSVFGRPVSPWAG